MSCHVQARRGHPGTVSQDVFRTRRGVAKRDAANLSAREVHTRLQRALTDLQRAERNAVLWFAEVMRRELYRELGYGSIYHYATEALGFSKSKTAQFIRLTLSLEELPVLRQAVANGDVSWTKAREVVTVATPKTEGQWVKAAQSSTRRELEQQIATVKAQVRSGVKVSQQSGIDQQARRRDGGPQVRPGRPARSGRERESQAVHLEDSRERAHGAEARHLAGPAHALGRDDGSRLPRLLQKRTHPHNPGGTRRRGQYGPDPGGHRSRAAQPQCCARDRDDCRMLNGTAEKHREIGRAAANIHDARAQFLLVLGQDRVARRQLLQHDVVNVETTSLHTLDDVLGRADGTGYHVHLGFEAHAGHTNRIPNPFLAVDQEFLWQDVQNFLICRNGHGARGVYHPVDVTIAHFLVPNCDDPVRVQAAYMAAGNTGINRVNVATRHQFRFLDGALNRVHGRLDIDDNAFLESARRVRTDANHFDIALVADLADDRDDLRRADVEPDNQVFVAPLVQGLNPATMPPSLEFESLTGERERFFQPIVNPLL